MTESADRVALVTGCSRGIGLATVTAFHAAGWRTVGVDLETPPSSSTASRFVQADIGDEREIDLVIESIANEERRLDALINNAAVQVCKPPEETTMAEWDRLMAVNLRAPFWLTRQALPLLRCAAGAVVNVSSVHAVATSRQMVAYATAKGGLTTMTRALASDFADYGVRVNAVLPGAVDTPMLRDGFSRGHVAAGEIETQLAAFGATHPTGRVARPEEIAQAILYLADNDRSSYVTGASLVVDGGVTVRLSTE